VVISQAPISSAICKTQSKADENEVPTNDV